MDWHALTVSAAFVVGALAGAAVVVALVKHLAGYLGRIGRREDDP